jgi:O-succinylbenzoic acid--CoA ligase
MGKIMSSGAPHNKFDWVDDQNSPQSKFLNFAIKILTLYQNNQSVWIGENQTIYKTESNLLESGPFLYFQSGGTSGTKKWVQHNHISMQSAVDGLTDYLGVGYLSSWCCLPLNHVGGMMQVIRAYRTGGKVFFLDYRNLFSEIGDDAYGKWLSLVPTQLFRLVRNKVSLDNLRRFRGIFLGGAALSENLVYQCRKEELPVYPTYGMSETCGMVAVLNKSNFLNGENGVGKALCHAKLKLSHENSRILVKSKSMALNVFAENEPKDGWLLTPDYGRQDDKGNWQIDGRSDRVIISGGEKINLDEIEKIISNCEHIDSCLILHRKDDEWGECIIFHGTPKTADLRMIQSYAKQCLKNFQVPKVWKLGDKLPLSAMGKIKN